MEDYFQLSLRKFDLDADSLHSDDARQASMPAVSGEYKAPTAAQHASAQDDAQSASDSTDPYNSTGRFYVKGIA